MKTEVHISLEQIVKVLEQQFPKELTIAVQQVKIQMLEQQLQQQEHSHEPEL